MKRRAFLLCTLALAASGAHAQPATRVFKVAILTTAGKRGETPF